MQTISLAGFRNPGSQTEQGDGSFYYSVDWEWAKWPEELRGVHALNGSFLKNGNLLAITDTEEAPIVELDPAGNVIRTIGAGLFQKAHNVFITEKNTLLVPDSGMKAHVVLELSMDGELLYTFGTKGAASDSGYDPDYLKVLEARGAVPADPAWNKRPDFNARLDSITRAGRPFGRPCAMITDPQGRYFAADGYANVAVHRFSPDRNLELTWGAPGKGPGQFRIVHDIYMDPLNRLWVADRENACVHVFDPDGNQLAYLNEGLFKVGGFWGDGEHVYIGELSGGVTIVDLEFRRLAQFGAPGSLLHGHGICGDAAGNLYVFTNKKSKTNNIVKLIRK